MLYYWFQKLSNQTHYRLQILYNPLIDKSLGYQNNKRHGSQILQQTIWPWDVFRDNIQGVKVNSGKSLGSKFGRIQCLHCNKRYLSRKSLISALIWHPESGCGTIRRLPRPHRRQEVKNPPRGPMLFAARGRGAVLRMPRPLLGCQIKAEIKGFLLM